jgi:ABC-type uncharacterized transport system substrate-binding protein
VHTAGGRWAGIVRASTSSEIDAAFADLGRERPDALFVGGDPFFNDRRVQLANTAAYHRVPATYSNRELAEAGGLMSYGTNISDAFRQVGGPGAAVIGAARARRTGMADKPRTSRRWWRPRSRMCASA